VPVNVSGQALADLGLGPAVGTVLQASAGGPGPAWRICEVQGSVVESYQDLREAFLHVRPEAKVTLGLERTDAPGGASPVRFVVEAARLRLIEQGVSPEAESIRIVDEGNPCVLLRDGGVRAKVVARAERERGLLQVVLSLSLTSGSERALPRDVRAFCDGTPLRCLTAAETLDRLYAGPRGPTPEGVADAPASFVAVSERSDYKIPTNVKRLEGQLLEVPAGPALAAVVGVAYPGSPVVGDARALAAFLLQREFYRTNAHPKVGWVVFAGESLRRGGRIQLDLDLGNGPKRIKFLMPGADDAVHQAGGGDSGGPATSLREARLGFEPR
jgi:hypothetical protein